MSLIPRNHSPVRYSPRDSRTRLDTLTVEEGLEAAAGVTAAVIAANELYRGSQDPRNRRSRYIKAGIGAGVALGAYRMWEHEHDKKKQIEEDRRRARRHHHHHEHLAGDGSRDTYYYTDDEDLADEEVAYGRGRRRLAYGEDRPRSWSRSRSVRRYEHTEMTPVIDDDRRRYLSMPPRREAPWVEEIVETSYRSPSRRGHHHRRHSHSRSPSRSRSTNFGDMARHAVESIIGQR